ncbi:MAG: hypothetical protein ACJAVV_000608 [Alphaproteobacteria bacterium]|jgi:uncharacterized protein YeaC (DUF1315 family)
MEIEQLLAVMSEDIYNKFKQAIETGKWLDGNSLSEEQRETVLQAVLLYQAKVEKSEEHMTVGKDGEIVQKSRQQLQQELNQAQSKQTNIARFKQDDF